MHLHKPQTQVKLQQRNHHTSWYFIRSAVPARSFTRDSARRSLHPLPAANARQQHDATLRYTSVHSGQLLAMVHVWLWAKLTPKTVCLYC